MSRSEERFRGEFTALIDQIESIERRPRDPAELFDIGFEEAGRLLGVAVRLYAKGADTAGDEIRGVPSLGLSATEAVVGAAALLHDQDLSPFDLWLWFQRVMREARTSNSFTSRVADLRENGINNQ